MSLEKFLTKQRKHGFDERQSYYNGLAARATLAVIYLYSFITGTYYFLALGGKEGTEKTFVIMMPILLGNIVYFSLGIKWKLFKQKDKS